MKVQVITLLIFLLAAAVPAEEKSSLPVNPITFQSEALGDSDAGVVTRITLRYSIPAGTPPDIPLVAQGSILQMGNVVRNFRYPVDQRNPVLRFVQTLPPGAVEIEARVMVPLEESSPVLLAKGIVTIAVAKTNKSYVASEEDGAEALIAEGAAVEMSGKIRISPPRRDLAPNLFIVDVQTAPPVTRVEFFVDGKKIFTRNAAPYRAELDLGKLPKRVEVRAVGYDASGRYVDADAWVVNERDNPLEVKITRTDTPDGISHFKVSLQNPQNRAIKSAVLFAGKKKLIEFARSPYAIALSKAQMAGVPFIRASVVDDTNYEASDLLFLDGQTFSEELEVNLVELPVSVTAASGSPITTLKQGDFTILEDKKPKKISSFAFSNNLPLSIGVLVDHSGSMKERMTAAREAASFFFKQIIGPSDRAFAGGFSFEASKLPNFTSSLSSLEEQVKGIAEAEGGTALYDAIVTGLYRFRAVPGRKALIIVTDGEDTTSRLSYDEMTSYVRTARIPIYFIGIDLSILDVGATSRMKALAAETGAIAYFVKDAKNLRDTYAKLESELRTQYLLGYYTESTKKDSKYRTIEVTTSQKGAKVRTIRGFIP